MTWAVTLDFHNTIASCDDWFKLEVSELMPAFFERCKDAFDIHVSAEQIHAGKDYYLKLRRRVMDTGIELDATSAVAEVTQHLGLNFSRATIAQGVDEVFRATVSGAEPLPGVIESVRRLRSIGIKLAVVSSAAYHPFLEWTLEKFEIDDCFDDVLTSASTGHYKSSTRIYETALNVLGVRPAKCIHIGDSDRFDVAPAAAVGMRTVLVGNEGPDSMADLHLSTLVGMPHALHERFGLPLAI